MRADERKTWKPILSGSIRLSARLACLSLVLAGVLGAQTLESLSASYRKTPNARTRAAMLRYAEGHKADKDGALALLALGATEVDQRQFGDALKHLQAAEKRLPQLADYIDYLTAVCDSELRSFQDVEKALQPVWQFSPASPLVGRAAALQANADLENGQAPQAIPVIEQHRSDLAGSQAELLLARAYEGSGNQGAAAEHYRNIYVYYPLSKEAADAAAALTRYPALPPTLLFARGVKLLDAGDYERAAKELEAVEPLLSSADLDLARVRIGVAHYLARDNKPAYAQLTSFEAKTADAEAERLYYLMETERRLDRFEEMNATVAKLSADYPQSRWRRDALISAGNYYSYGPQKQPDLAATFFQTCADSFPSDPQSATCHWKIAWPRYLKDQAGAETLLEEHLKRYPDSDHASTALYFLGRIAELKSDWSAARAYYEEISSRFPNYYYATLARERLQSAPIVSATRSAEAVQFLAAIKLPSPRSEDFQPSALTRQRIDRAHLLASAGLDDFAEAELRFGAKADGQPQIMAWELADLANQRQSPDQGIRYIKRYAPNYLSLSLDTAPEKFWKLAFPMPYQKQLEALCRPLSLDPYLVAALIRQESEFNPKAVSHSNARGLTQVMPATGRQLSRQLGMRSFRTSMLFNPDTNLKLGTYYLKALSDQLEGKWEATLASYNAGKSRVLSWLADSNFHEPAEFVESIPFNETRAYVQSVLRNAEVYRRLYGAKTVAAKTN
ncbi:MAG TPA: transglycosylase SLT domain-containing protein [Bryobacteraceae bacterium]|nr:transglycosylase SLT domain-containing protein [Bryobacteraceae bacterium]